MPDKPRTRKTMRSESEWRQIIQNYKESQLTQDEFCQQTGIPKSSFYNWHRRLKSATDDPTPNFVSLSNLNLSDSNGLSWDIELDLGQGVCLRLRGS